jgi:hypothetical protein
MVRRREARARLGAEAASMRLHRIKRYGTRRALNPGYVSVSVPVPVPRAVLVRAIGDAMLVTGPHV